VGLQPFPATTENIYRRAEASYFNRTGAEPGEVSAARQMYAGTHSSRCWEAARVTRLEFFKAVRAVFSIPSIHREYPRPSKFRS